MTSSALNFIGSETFKGITHNKVFYDLWSEENDYIEHINLGLKADCIVIAPSTYNNIYKIADFSWSCYSKNNYSEPGGTPRYASP